jgi:hypothetical protein
MSEAAVAIEPSQGAFDDPAARQHFKPAVSVTMWRLRPLTFLAASQPRGPPLSVVLTDWLSMTPADGLASRPAASRVYSNSSKLTLSNTPWSRQA